MFVGLTFQKGLHGKKGEMRQSLRSTLSAGRAPSGSVRRAVSVVLLDKQELQVLVEAKGKVADVFSQVCGHLGLRETEYFGLAQFIDTEYHFTDLDLKVSKLAPKVRHGLRNLPESQSVLTLHFRVQFYVDHVMLLRERVTRHQYYLQLRDNLVTAAQVCGAERCFLLAAYALQADLGSYNAHKHARAYFDPREYFPAWVISKHGCEYIVTSMPAMHGDLSGMTKMEAQMHYIKDVSAPPAAHNLHFYRLKKRKMDNLGTAWIGICPKGVEIYEELDDGFKNLLSTFLWPNIRKLIFEKKKFEIRAVGTPTGRKLTYYTGSDARAKYLLSLCRTTHQFQMDVQPKLAEIRHLEAEDKRRFRSSHREAYIYSDRREIDQRVGRGTSGRSRLSHCSSGPGLPTTDTGLITCAATPTPCGGGLDQRVSVISNTSSNTTSGIVSDKMYMSFDDSEADYYQVSDDVRSMEIMIDCPPSKAPSNYGSYTAPHPRNTPLHGTPVYKGSGLSNSPPSLTRIGDLPRRTSSSSRTHSGVSRTSSCHSQHSGQFVLPPITTLAEVHTLPIPIPVPIPADVQIQRLNLAPAMAVSSTPIPPGVTPVFGGVVTSGAPTQPIYANMPVSNPTYMNVRDVMSSEQYVTAPAPVNYVTDVPSLVGQTFVAESHPIQQVATAIISRSTIHQATSLAAPLTAYNSGPTQVVAGSPGMAVVSSEYHTPVEMPPLKVLSVNSNPSMVVTSQPHVPPGVAAQQCLPVDACLPMQPIRLPQTTPPLTPHLTHASLAPPTDQALPSHHTPPTAHITPPTLHKAPLTEPLTMSHQPKLASLPVQLESTLAHTSDHHEALIGAVALTPASSTNVACSAVASSPGPPLVMDHSVTVNDHTAQPSTPLTVLPPTITPTPVQTLTVPPSATMVTPPDYPQASPCAADQEPATGTPPPSPAKAVLTPGRQRGGLVATGEAWGFSNNDMPIRGAGRVQQRHHSMGKYDQLLSPNAGRDPEKRHRSRRSKTCPAHGMLPDVAAELQGLSSKNLSLPLLSALCSDLSLVQQIQEKCSCSAAAGRHSNISMLSVGSSVGSPHATLITTDTPSGGLGIERPVSWHSDTFSVDQTFRLLQDEQLLYQDGASPVIPGSLNYSPPPVKGAAKHPAPHPHLALLDPVPVRSHSDELASLTSTQLQATPLMAGLLAPSLSLTRTSLKIDSPKPGGSGAMFPSKLTSGGHSPNSSETLHQQASMGLA